MSIYLQKNHKNQDKVVEKSGTGGSLKRKIAFATLFGLSLLQGCSSEKIMQLKAYREGEVAMNEKKSNSIFRSYDSVEKEAIDEGADMVRRGDADSVKIFNLTGYNDILDIKDDGGRIVITRRNEQQYDNRYDNTY